MSLPTPSTSVSHRRFHQCVNHENKLDLRHPLPSFGSFGFFQASIWLKNEQTLVKLSSDFYFNVASWFQGNVHIKPHFNTLCVQMVFMRTFEANAKCNINNVWSHFYKFLVVLKYRRRPGANIFDTDISRFINTYILVVCIFDLFWGYLCS